MCLICDYMNPREKYQMNGKRQLLYHCIKVKVYIIKMNVIIIEG